MNRRRFLKYAGTTAAVVGASALGLKYFLTSKTSKVTQTTTVGPLTIEDLQWNPTRTVNSKVYDGTVGFTVDNLNPSDQITLDFGSIYPSGMPRTAFTSEADRTYAFTGTSKKQTFSQGIVNLIGGRQYRALVTVKDKNGKETVNYIDTPYVREFENIAKDAGILIGASYYTWLGNPWYKLSPSVMPLLGLYSTSNPLVASKHIDWATGLGIHHFYCAYTPGTQDGGITAADKRVETLINNSLIGDIKFAMLYETGERLAGETEDLSKVNLNEPSTFSTIQSDFAHIAKKYFSHPSYLIVDGRPVVYIYATGAIKSDIVAPFAKLRQYLKDLGFEPYLIGDEIEIRWGERINSNRLKAFDAVTGYTLPPTGNYVDRSPSAVRAEYSRWQSAAHSVGVEIVPSVSPGFDDRYLVQIGYRAKSYGYVPRSIEYFKTNLQIAKEFVDKSKLLKISTWNEWEENTNIEPTVEEGYGYLQTLRDTLAGQ